jgi:hypothetical protein
VLLHVVYDYGVLSDGETKLPEALRLDSQMVYYFSETESMALFRMPKTEACTILNKTNYLSNRAESLVSQRYLNNVPSTGFIFIPSHH